MTMPGEDCIQKENISSINNTLKYFQEAEARRERREERMLDAMEDIAAQGATIVNIEHRTTKLEKDVTDAFGVIRGLSDRMALSDDLDYVEKRVKNIELVQAHDKGKTKVEMRNVRFWDEVKRKTAPYAVGMVLFVIYLLDRFNVGVKLAQLWKEMKG